MRIYRDATEVEPAERAVTIGAFDGVHLGHRAVLRLVRDLARARNLSATVMTFDRHPAEVVRPESAPCLLTTLEQKLELLGATGEVDECFVLTFDAARSKEPAEQFVEEILASESPEQAKELLRLLVKEICVHDRRRIIPTYRRQRFAQYLLRWS